MQQTINQDYKSLLSEVIKKQIVILGPDITLIKARNVNGITVSDDGTVTEIIGEPQTITQNLIDQFVQLSGLIVQKTMEPLLTYHSEGTQPVAVLSSTMPAPLIPSNQEIVSTVTPPTEVVTTLLNPVQPTITSIDKQFHSDQVDNAAQKIIDDALKQQKI